MYSKRKGRRGSRSSSRNDLDKLELSDTTSSESSDNEPFVFGDEEEEKNEAPVIHESRSRPEMLKPKIPFFLTHFSKVDEIPPPMIPYEPPPPYVQSIIGVHEQDEISDVDQVFYTKWIGRAYIHCSYECKEDLRHCDGGPAALKKFLSMMDNYTMTQSPTNPDLSLFDVDDDNESWYDIERVIAHDDDKYLIKWCNLPYDQCTWETLEDIGEEESAKQRKAFEDRKAISAPIRYVPEPNVEPSQFKKIEEPPTNPAGLKLRDYQLDGLNWLRYCWYSHRNSILADEMGLGKTVQIVTTLVDISKSSGIRGPYLVIAPLSTLHHWQHEFENWSDLNAIVYHGNPLGKEVIQRYEMTLFKEDGLPDESRMKCEVVITNYETIMSDYDVFKRIQWRYLVLDEGHRLKNHQGKCYKMLQAISFKHCTLLTGTPIQNNVEELWSLLHFLHPNIFNDLNHFLSEFGQIETAGTLENLQNVIKPFLLRRKKNDVETTIGQKEETIIEVELTRVQKTFYRAFLEQNKDVLMSQVSSGALPSLKNLMMELRKVCNHPFLIKDAEEKIENDTRATMPGASDEDVQLKALVQSSGKLILIDKLLPKLKKDNHKVLIFSQMVKVLDLLEQYIELIGLTCERIDGSVPENERQSAIDRFGSDKDAFIFLLCTRAGGVGINLTAADTVIIYDSDWNPQNDIQAQSRCHRIGQTQNVKVYRLVTRGTYELEMLDRASKKLGLDHALLDSVEVSSNPKMEAKEIEKLLRCGVYDIANDDDTAIDNFCAADIDQILDSHTKELTSNVNQTNVSFSKAKFDVDQDKLDLNAADFWKQVMPNLKSKTEEPLQERRCRKKTHSFADSDDDIDIGGRSKKAKNQPTGIKQFVRDITRHGFRGGPGERTALYTATENAKLDPADEAIILSLLQIESFDDKPEEIATLQSKYINNLKECKDKSSQIIARTILFYNLGLVLTAVQGDIDIWPTIGIDEDPQFEYALMYAVYKNGFIEHDRIFNGTGYKTEKSLQDRDLVKTMKQLIKCLAPLAAEYEVADKSFLTPEEWKLQHEKLFSRTILSDEEFIFLFQLICAFGLPYDPDSTDDSKVDFHEIYNISNFKCITYDAFSAACQEIVDLADDNLSQAQTDEILKRLGDYGNKVQVKKLRDNIKDLKRIRIFKARMGDAEKEIIPKMRSFENGPDWWTDDHDIALLNALAKYGLVYVSVWLVDPTGPFVGRIPSSSFDSFSNCAALERTRGKPVRPKEAGDFSVLYNDKQRLGRITGLLNFVEGRLERLARQSVSNAPDEPATYVPTITELPDLPYEAGPQLTILDFGEFQPGFDTYPVGFVSKRQYFSLNDPTEKTWYQASTRVQDGKFQFVVTFLDDPEKVFVSHTPSGAWEALIQALQKERGKRGLVKRKHTTVSGPFMYGFSHETVSVCLQILRNREQTNK